MSVQFIPTNYDEWRHCITVICQQPLTLDFVEERIQALTNPTDYMTVRFVELYGDGQRLNTLQWLEQERKRLAP